MKMQILPWLCLIMCAQAIALIASHSIEADMNLKPSTRDDEQLSSTRGVEAVVRERRGANGGTDLVKKPSQNKNGGSDLLVKSLGGITFCVVVLLNCFFLLL